MGKTKDLYMQAWEERYYDKEEARQEGLEEGTGHDPGAY